MGSLGCPCMQGDGCDAGLTCVVGECVEGVSPPCERGIPTDDCCGDGVVDTNEQCDLGGMNADDGNCTTLCKYARCGDGFVHEPIEACDGDDHCTAECTFETCGDGVVDQWEWCEPMLRPNDPDCTHLCTDARKIVFITSTHYRGGDLGGIAGANTKCQEHADAVGLDGDFWAYLASGISDAPATTWQWSKATYVDVLGTPILGFIPPGVPFCGSTGTLDESGNPHSKCDTLYLGSDEWAWYVHDYSEDDPPVTCGGWTNVAGNGRAMTLSPCSQNNMGAPCSAAAPIICVEQ